MTTTRVQATYTQGTFRPTTQIDLPEGARVEIQISELPLAVASSADNFGSLAGIWRSLTDADLNDIEADLAAMRGQTRDRLERLANDR